MASPKNQWFFWKIVNKSWKNWQFLKKLTIKLQKISNFFKKSPIFWGNFPSCACAPHLRFFDEILVKNRNIGYISPIFPIFCQKIPRYIIDGQFCFDHLWYPKYQQYFNDIFRFFHHWLYYESVWQWF